MKYFLYLFAYFLFSNSCYSQKQTNAVDEIVNLKSDDTLRILKEISLCNCLNTGFPNDSLQFKDQSMYILMESIDFSFDYIDSLTMFTNKFMIPYKTSRRGQNKENTQNSRIMLGCISFFKSNELDTFLKKFYKANMK